MELTFKALAEPVRREMLDVLRDGPRTTGELCARFASLSRFQVMSHIRVLKQADLVSAESRGRERLNHLNAEPLRAAYEDWYRHYEVLWAGRLGRLKRLVETDRRSPAMDQRSVPPSDLTTLEIEQEVEIKAPPARVFRALTDDIGLWWGAPYLQNADAATDMILEARPGGLMKEVTRGGDGAVWGTVQEVRRDRLLVLEGRMGMRPAIFARTTFDLSDSDAKATRIAFSVRAVGSFTAEHQEIFGGGLGDLLGNRLKAYLEKGEESGVRARD